MISKIQSLTYLLYMMNIEIKRAHTCICVKTEENEKVALKD